MIFAMRECHRSVARSAGWGGAPGRRSRAGPSAPGCTGAHEHCDLVPARPVTFSLGRAGPRLSLQLARNRGRALASVKVTQRPSSSPVVFSRLGTEETPVLPRRVPGRGSLACRRARIGRRNDGPRRGRTERERESPWGGSSGELGPEPGQAKEQGPTSRKKRSSEGSTCGRWIRRSSRISDPRTGCLRSPKPPSGAGMPADPRIRRRGVVGRHNLPPRPAPGGRRFLARPPPPRAPGRKVQEGRPAGARDSALAPDAGPDAVVRRGCLKERPSTGREGVRRLVARS
jgi:hypothetical protein